MAIVATAGLAIAPAGAALPTAGTPANDSDRLAAHQVAVVQAETARVAQTAQQLKLSSGEELVLRSVLEDPDGTRHVRYDRSFKGLQVVGGDLVVRRAAGGAIRGVIYNQTGKASVASTTPKLSVASAKARAGKSAAQTQLVVFAAKGAPVLAYDVITRGVKPDQTPFVLHSYLDATSGKLLASQDDIHTGTGNTMYSGRVAIGTSRPGTLYELRDPTRGGTGANHTTDMRGATGNATGVLFTDADDVWGNGTTSSRQTAGADAHYGSQVTWDYYRTTHNRLGIWNSANRGARSRVHYGNAYVNAFWDGTQMTYGDGANNQRPLTSLDVAGHEMSHGVTGNTARLNYFGDAGGLNESTSDIFGTTVEFFANNASDPGDYLIGEKINIRGNGTPLRWMDRPSRDGRSVDCWSSSTGGMDPHYSSGPLNHWFYLASEGTGSKVIGGVTHTSTACNGATITPVGRAVAERVWYRTLSTKLTSSSNYTAARNGAVASARELYGAGSVNCQRIAAAFSAINVSGTTTC